MKTSKRKISSISNIEADILLVIWDKGKATVREVHEKLLEKEYEKKENEFLPYTTALSAMGNLVAKEILNRDSRRKTHIYATRLNRKELAKSIIKSVADKIL